MELTYFKNLWVADICRDHAIGAALHAFTPVCILWQIKCLSFRLSVFIAFTICSVIPKEVGFISTVVVVCFVTQSVAFCPTWPVQGARAIK